MTQPIGSRQPPSRPASPVASMGVPIGLPSYAGASARTAHAPVAEAGALGGTLPQPGGEGLGSDVGADLVAGDALLETGLADTPRPDRAAVEDTAPRVEGQAHQSQLLDEALEESFPASDPVSPFVPSRGMPTDGTRVEAVAVERGTDAGANATTASSAADDDGLTAEGPGTPAAPSADVELGGSISDAVDEGAGVEGDNGPTESSPADAGAQGANL